MYIYTECSRLTEVEDKLRINYIESDESAKRKKKKQPQKQHQRQYIRLIPPVPNILEQN